MTGPAFQVLRGDCLDLLRDVEPRSVDLVLADPPYSSGGQSIGARSAATGRKYVSGGVDFSGDNRDQRSWYRWMSWWLGLALKAAKPGSICALFTDWRQLPTTTDALQAGGWVWRGVSAWSKQTNVRPQLGRPLQSCEFIAWGTAGPRDIEGKVGPGTHFGDAPREREHQTEKPVALLREWVRLAPEGGLVLDPFAGSGSTGEAAILEGRRFLGMELTEHYHGVASRRLAGIDAIGARSSPEQPSLFAG